jgi:hypothetical protein
METNTNSKKRASNFMTVLGVSADITAIAALIFNKDLNVFIQIASVAGSRCTKALTAQRDPHPEILPVKTVRACFKTSGGKTGWLLSNDASFDGEPYTVLNIKVFTAT